MRDQEIPPKLKEISDFAARLQGGEELRETEAERLSELLKSRPKAKRWFIENMALAADLHILRQEDDLWAGLETPKPGKVAPKIVRPIHWAVPTALAASIAVALTVLAMSFLKTDPEVAQATPETEPSEAEAQLDFSSGATVIVEGPMEIEVRSEEELSAIAPNAAVPVSSDSDTPIREGAVQITPNPQAFAERKHLQRYRSWKNQIPLWRNDRRILVYENFQDKSAIEPGSILVDGALAGKKRL